MTLGFLIVGISLYSNGFSVEESSKFLALSNILSCSAQAALRWLKQSEAIPNSLGLTVLFTEAMCTQLSLLVTVFFSSW